MRRTLLVGLVLILTVSTVTVAPAGAREPTGKVDRTFGRSGVASVNLPGVDYAAAGAAQEGGKLVLAGVADGAVAIARFTKHGRLDRNFGIGGVNRIPVGDLSGVRSVQMGPGGSIFLAGWTQSRPRRSGSDLVDDWASFALDRVRLVVIKLTPKGFLDPSFGDRGILSTAPGAFRPIDDCEVDMVVTPVGAVVVLAVQGVSAGYLGFAGGAVLVRFTPGGTTDGSFGVGGVAPAGPPGVVPAPAALALQSDGRLVVGATWLEPGLAPFAPPSWDLLVTRHLANGLLDPTFGTAGLVRRDVQGGTDAMSDLIIDGAGRIVIIGDALEGTLAAAGPNSNTFGWSPFVMRLTASGATDSSFGRDGVSVLEGDGLDLIFAGPGAVQADGGVLLTALAVRGGTASTQLVRFRVDGHRDQGFESVTVPLRGVTSLSIGGGRAFAGGWLGEDHEGRPDTFAAAAFAVRP